RHIAWTISTGGRPRSQRPRLSSNEGSSLTASNAVRICSEGTVTRMPSLPAEPQRSRRRPSVARGDRVARVGHRSSIEDLWRWSMDVQGILRLKGTAVVTIRPDDTIGHLVDGLARERIGAMV